MPDTICVVVEWVGTPEARWSSLYGDVLTRLDAAIWGASENLRIFPNSDFAKDLQFTELERILQRPEQRRRGLLVSLRSRDGRARDAAGGEMPDPKIHDEDFDEDDIAAMNPPRGPMSRPEVEVVLPPNGGDTTWLSLNFYGIGAGGAEKKRGEAPLVRELTNLINIGGALGLGQRAEGREWRIIGVTPDWRLAGGQDDETTPGPGALPEQAPDVKSGRFGFGDKAAAEIAGGTGEGVVVAVLDTSPQKKRVSEAAADSRGNWLLKKVNERVDIDGPLSIHPHHFLRRLPHAVVKWHAPFTPSKKGHRLKYKMPDHGLFAAGIIQSIAPQAEIHLIRVLSDFGVGTVQILASTLMKLPNAFLRNEDGTDNGKKLVINLSLMVDLPPGVSICGATRRSAQPPSVEFMNYWFPKTAASGMWTNENEIEAILKKNKNAEVREGIKLTHVSLQSLTEWLSAGPSAGQDLAANDRRKRILCVAASGNDALGADARPQTRLPARYDNVLGVASVTTTGAPSSFSNRGDELDMGNGVAVPGGNAMMPSTGGPPVIDREAVTGIFSRRELPFDRGLNEKGWVRWAGTSFATPTISGIAALIWSMDRNRNLSPTEIIATITGAKNGDAAELACPWILAYQEP